MNSSAPAPSNESNHTNGETSIDDLFALSDEQILEIDAEAQDVETSSAHPDANDFDDLTAPAPTPERPVSRHDLASHRGTAEAQPTGATSEAGRAEHSPTRSASANATDSTAAPPQWLADRMSDPQHGTEARELWNSSRAAHQEAAAFREVFAKPDDARAAAQRARLLDDIDRAYFAGDATQRASLAASMLREDPAAFREMVFAGLRALEQANQGTGAATVQISDVGAQHAAPQLGNTPPDRPVAKAPNSNVQSMSQLPGPTNLEHIASYTAFERSANEDLERTVGTAIDRTLDQALPHATRADSTAMKTRLAETIRQDIEKALQGDRQLGGQVAQVLSARRFDNESRASVVRLIGERAQQLVPGVAKRVLSEWTQTTLSAHRSQRGRADAATTRREVEPTRPAGGPATAATQSGAAPRAAATAASSQRSRQAWATRQDAGPLSRPGSTRGVDYRRLSDEQILDL